jgi:hypothetical protein
MAERCRSTLTIQERAKRTAAKTKRCAVTGYDLQNACAAHIEASANAHDWTEKCLALRQAGKAAQAKAAENKAKRWLRRMMVIERAANEGKAVGGAA